MDCVLHDGILSVEKESDRQRGRETEGRAEFTEVDPSRARVCRRLIKATNVLLR